MDFRSDTVTRPTPAMRAALAAAEVGDDVFGDDPTVNRLQDHLAARLGFAAGLFCASGTQANLCAVFAHCARGDAMIVGEHAHTWAYEAGGAAVLASVHQHPLPHAPDGTLPLERIAAAIQPDDPHFPRTRLLALENTLHGKVLPAAYTAAAAALAAGQGLAAHLDGARLFNAAVATAGPGGDPWVAARALTAGFGSVSVCLSKGLGAPAGTVLLGGADFIARARRARKLLGGGMRQAGLLAAAGLHALEHHVARLADDHALARRLADGLAGLPGLTVEPPQTNMVFVDVAAGHAAALAEHLARHGVRGLGTTRLRLVTHLDVTAADVDQAVAAFRAFNGEARRAAPAASL
jgi:threonine aldolase